MFDFLAEKGDQGNRSKAVCCIAISLYLQSDRTKERFPLQRAQLKSTSKPARASPLSLRQHGSSSSLALGGTYVLHRMAQTQQHLPTSYQQLQDTSERSNNLLPKPLSLTFAATHQSSHRARPSSRAQGTYARWTASPSPSLTSRATLQVRLCLPPALGSRAHRSPLFL